MRIEQAFYGETGGGHGLLKASRNDEVSRRIVQRLDLPDAAPQGVTWWPFLRGFPYRDQYVLCRTFLDRRAPRGGMVFSHALIVSLDEIVRISSLGGLLEFLAIDERARPAAEAIDFAVVEEQPPDADDLMDAAEAFASSAGLPIVRAGHAGFDQLVVAIWGRLLPEMRRNFAFRLSFSPNDLVEEPAPALICTPHAMLGRWTNYQVIGSGNSSQPTSLVSALLSGRGNAEPLLEFMCGIGAKPATFTELRLLDQACRMWKEKSRPESGIGVVRLVGRLSPNSDVGCDLKEIIIRRLQAVISGASIEQILLIRNLQLSAFPSPDQVWQTLENSVAENTYSQDQDHHLLTALEDIASDGAVSEWQVAFQDGLSAAARSRKSNFHTAFWRWIQRCPEFVDAVLNQVVAESDVERRLAEAAPRNITQDIAEALLLLARSRRWLRIHGAVLSAVCNPLDAARQQINVDTDLSSMESVRISLRNATPEEVLNCALEIGDPRTILLAGETVANNPKLLGKIVDFGDMNAQAVWREALAIDSEAWQGPVNPAVAFHAVLDCLLDGGETDLCLINQLSLTPIADLGSYPRRTEMWMRVDGTVLDNFLVATARGWLKHASSGRVPFGPEALLQCAILAADEFEPTLNELIPGRLGTVVRVVAALDDYEEERFRRLTHEVLACSSLLSAPDAEAIGRLIRNRNWEVMALSLVDRYRSGRKDLKPALRVFHDMLDFWTRLWLGLKPLSEDEKWEAFENLATELYSSGPNEEGIWERAGGKNADLSLQDNGRSQWRKALGKSRRGKGVRPIAILKVMQEDFPNNEQIVHLADDPAFNEGK